MKRVLLAAVAGLVIASAASAQSLTRPVSVGVGGGVSMADRSMGIDLNRGYHLEAMVGLSVPGLPVGLRGEAMYHHLGVYDADAALNITSIGGSLTYDVMPTPMVTPYLVGGGALYHLTASGADNGGVSKFGVSGGAGVRFHLAQMRMFAEGRYHMIKGATNLVPVSLGIMF